MTGIIDYGMGNLLSVFNAITSLGAPAKICPTPDGLAGMDRLILPGVGAFRDCIASLRQRGFVDELDCMRRRGTPIFGICLGMQAMARRGFEGGVHEGLGWFDGEVVRLTPDDPSLRVPQIGWNQVSYRADSPLFAGQRRAPDFYFVHSYALRCDDENDVEATCDYGGPVTAAVRKDNVFATQFHPEKSQDNGLHLLEKFLSWKP